MTLTATVLGLAWSLSAALVFAVLIQSLIGRRIPALLSMAFVTVLILGADLLLGITDGVLFIMNSALVSLVQQSITVFSLGVVLAAIGILSMTIAALWVVISDAIEG